MYIPGGSFSFNIFVGDVQAGLFEARRRVAKGVGSIGVAEPGFSMLINACGMLSLPISTICRLMPPSAWLA